VRSEAEKAKKQTARGRKQDRARVTGCQKCEVSHEAKTRKSAGAVKKAVRRSATAGREWGARRPPIQEDAGEIIKVILHHVRYWKTYISGHGFCGYRVE
jgi:hypothetical protein